MTKEERVKRNVKIKKYFNKLRNDGIKYQDAWEKTAKKFKVCKRVVFEIIKKTN